MKIIAGWVIALAMFAGTGTAIALNVKPQWTSERCVGLSCWPDSQVAKYRPAQRTTAPSSHQSGVLREPELASQASRIDRSRKGDRIRVVPATEAILPPECEPPFSPLVKLAPSNFIARCLT
jgi:hypothetical protein